MYQDSNVPFQTEVEPHSFEVIDRPDGYLEFRCLPTTWSYEGEDAISGLIGELLSSERGADPMGVEVSEFWSASDTALRIQSLARDDIALRELTLLATRPETGINWPRPWFSQGLIDGVLGPEEGHHHDDSDGEDREAEAGDLWSHHGMVLADHFPVQTGWDMRLGPMHSETEPWHGGTGKWFSWSVVNTWGAWPRLQDADSLTSAPNAGRLLLFVSHRWEGREHPDPAGRQLTALLTGLTLSTAKAIRLLDYEREERTSSGLPELIARFIQTHGMNLMESECDEWAEVVEECARGVETEEEFREAMSSYVVPQQIRHLQDEILLWYDYASMFQRPRTAAEDAQFQDQIRSLNTIQESAATVVIAGDDSYIRRAWCFLELCGGMRQTITEVIPSWGEPLRAFERFTDWGTLSDQFIGALNSQGEESIAQSGLEATYPEDLPQIARLMAMLPLLGQVLTDDSDIVGGVLPYPMREGLWTLRGTRPDGVTQEDHIVDCFTRSQAVVDREVLIRASEEYGGCDRLEGRVGIWVYSCQRVLSLTWASLSPELLEWIAAKLDSHKIARVLNTTSTPSVACLWADAYGLSDDGLGWTRIIPSRVDVLVVITQMSLAEVSRIYEDVQGRHLADGVPVVTASPLTGEIRVETPDKRVGDADREPANVIAVPRVRRSSSYARQMMVNPSVRKEQVELLPALRLDSGDGFVGDGRVHRRASGGPLGRWGRRITAARLLPFGVQRARAEGVARGLAASWRSLAESRVGLGEWRHGFAPLQLTIIENLARRAVAVSDDPRVRARFLDSFLSDYEGYLLPSSMLDWVDEYLDQVEGSGPQLE